MERLGDSKMTCVLERKAQIKTNKHLTDHLYVMELIVEDIPSLVLPGQFVHVQIPGMEGHILRRPFSVYHTKQSENKLTILYQIVGFGTQKMTTLGAGDTVDVMGPIGHGWAIPATCQSALLVGGGVGAAPLYMHAQELYKADVSVDVVLGAQTEAALVCKDRYEALLGQSVPCSTDDGTYGYHGFCTDLVSKSLDKRSYDYVACCGPEPMMKAVCAITLDRGIPTFVSLEKRMACGIGACLSCVVETTNGLKRSCVDGPVFNASEVIW